MPGVGLARIGEAHGAARTVEQHRPQGSLELFDLLRQGRLGDMQSTGRPGEVPMIGDGE